MNVRINKPEVLIVFDFDGVVVDSIEFLYKTYLNFLNDFDFQGNEKEFNQLNGPKLSEGIAFLKKKYNLSMTQDELSKNYINRLSYLYDEVKLIDHIQDILVWLKNRDYKIALASSCGRNEINKVFQRFDLTKYFDLIVTGDDVKKAKPAPEIYKLVQSEFPKHLIYVVEDSENGIQSAISAGLTTIHYTNSKKEINKKVNHIITSHDEIKDIITEIELNCFTIAQIDRIILKPVDYTPEFNLLRKERINKIWDDELKNRNLINGKVVCYKSHKKDGDTLIVLCYVTQYKYFFAQLKDPNLNLNISPIGVSGIIIDEENNTLLGVRKNVSEYENYQEFVPAGGIDASKIKNEIVLFEEQLIAEFEEETKISRTFIKSITPFCFIFDKEHCVYDIGAKILVNEPLKKILKSNQNDEYKDINVLNIDNKSVKIDKSNCVPTSLVLLINFKKTIVVK